MLKPVQNSHISSLHARVAVVVSEYNKKFVEGMLSAALSTLAEAGVEDVHVIRVPGAFEIPVTAAMLLRTKKKQPDVIICLGVILRGETAHADHVGQTVSCLLGKIAVETGVPLVHEVLLLDSEAQARKRCLGKRHNRGAEAVQTALKIRKTLKSL